MLTSIEGNIRLPEVARVDAIPIARCVGGLILRNPWKVEIMSWTEMRVAWSFTMYRCRRSGNGESRSNGCSDVGSQLAS